MLCETELYGTNLICNFIVVCVCARARAYVHIQGGPQNWHIFRMP